MSRSDPGEGIHRDKDLAACGTRPLTPTLSALARGEGAHRRYGESERPTDSHGLLVELVLHELRDRGDRGLRLGADRGHLDGGAGRG
jgi:hypothetical protein